MCIFTQAHKHTHTRTDIRRRYSVRLQTLHLTVHQYRGGEDEQHMDGSNLSCFVNKTFPTSLLCVCVCVCVSQCPLVTDVHQARYTQFIHAVVLGYTSRQFRIERLISIDYKHEIASSSLELLKQLYRASNSLLYLSGVNSCYRKDVHKKVINKQHHRGWGRAWTR